MHGCNHTYVITLPFIRAHAEHTYPVIECGHQVTIYPRPRGTYTNELNLAVREGHLSAPTRSIHIKANLYGQPVPFIRAHAEHTLNITDVSRKFGEYLIAFEAMWIGSKKGRQKSHAASIGYQAVALALFDFLTGATSLIGLPKCRLARCASQV